MHTSRPPKRLQCFSPTRPLVLLGLLVSLFASCSRDDDQFYISDLRNKEHASGMALAEHPQMPTLEVTKNAIREGYLSEMLEITNVIYLDNNVPVGKIDKLLFYKDMLCVFDREITNTLTLFDRNGRYLRTIGQQGEGPGEYAHIHDAQVNPYTNFIDLWDGNTQKMLSYDENGALISERHIDVFAHAFGIVDTSVYLFYKGNSIMEPGLDYKLIAVDANTQEVAGKLFQIREQESHFTVQDPGIVLNYNAANGKQYFHRLFDDHIYVLKDGQMTMEYRIDFKNRALHYDQINFNQDKNKIIRDWIFNPDYFTMVGNAMETEEHLFFTFGQGTRIVYAFHHKTKGKTQYFMDFWNDITGTTIPKPLNADQQGNVYFADEPGMYIETVRTAARYDNTTEAEVLKKWKREQPVGYEIYNHISEFDNPIILVGRYIF